MSPLAQLTAAREAFQSTTATRYSPKWYEALARWDEAWKRCCDSGRSGLPLWTKEEREAYARQS